MCFREGGVAQYRSLPLSWYEDQHDHASTDCQPGMAGTTVHEIKGCASFDVAPQVELHTFSFCAVNHRPYLKSVTCLPQIQIGCQTDYLSAEEVMRAPSVHVRFPVCSEMMQVWNLWGGLIYIIAPPKTHVQDAEVTVQVAVLAPYYKSGESLVGETFVTRVHGSDTHSVQLSIIWLCVLDTKTSNLNMEIYNLTLI